LCPGFGISRALFHPSGVELERSVDCRQEEKASPERKINLGKRKKKEQGLSLCFYSIVVDMGTQPSHSSHPSIRFSSGNTNLALNIKKAPQEVLVQVVELWCGSLPERSRRSCARQVSLCFKDLLSSFRSS